MGWRLIPINAGNYPRLSYGESSQTRREQKETASYYGKSIKVLLAMPSCNVLRVLLWKRLL